MMNSIKRQSHTKFTPFQNDELEKCFILNRNLTFERLIKLSKYLHLESTQIKFWFKNRRRQHKIQNTFHQKEVDRSYDEMYQAMISESISSSPISSSRRCKSRIYCSIDSCKTTSSSDHEMLQYSNIDSTYQSSKCQQFKRLALFQNDTNTIQQQQEPYKKQQPQQHQFDKEIIKFDSKNDAKSDSYYMRISKSLASDGKSSSLVSDDAFPSYYRMDKTTGRLINPIDEIDESSKKLLQNLGKNDKQADGSYTKRSMTSFFTYPTKIVPTYESIIGPSYQCTMNNIMSMQPYTYQHHIYTSSIINNVPYLYFYDYY